MPLALRAIVFIFLTPLFLLSCGGNESTEPTEPSTVRTERAPREQRDAPDSRAQVQPSDAPASEERSPALDPAGEAIEVARALLPREEDLPAVSGQWRLVAEPGFFGAIEILLDQPECFELEPFLRPLIEAAPEAIGSMSRTYVAETTSGTQIIAFAAGVYDSAPSARGAQEANEGALGPGEVSRCVESIGGMLLIPDAVAAGSSTFGFTIPISFGVEQIWEVHYFARGEIFAAVSFSLNDPDALSAIPAVVNSFESVVNGGT